MREHKTPDEIIDSMLREMQFHAIPPEVVVQECAVCLASVAAALTDSFETAKGMHFNMDMEDYMVEVVINRIEKEKDA